MTLRARWAHRAGLLLGLQAGEHRLEIAAEVIPPVGDAGEPVADAQELGRDRAAGGGRVADVEAGGGAGVVQPLDRLDRLLQPLGGDAGGRADINDAAGGAGLVGGAVLEAAVERGAEPRREHAHGGGEQEQEDEAAVVEGASHHAPEAEQDGGPAQPAQRPRRDPQDDREEAQEDERDHQHEERGGDEQEGVGGEIAEEVLGHEGASLPQLVEEEGAPPTSTRSR